MLQFKNLKMGFMTVMWLLMLVGFQNCGGKQFELNTFDSTIEAASNRPLVRSIMNSGVENPSQPPMLSLMSDGYLVNNNGSVTVTAGGEAIFVWQAANARSCSLVGLVVTADGGPQAFRNLDANRTYEFACENSYGRSSIQFQTTLARSTPSNSQEKFPVDVFIIAGQSNAVGQDIPDQSFVAPQNKVLRFHNGALQGVNALGAWASFGKVYSQKTQRAIVFIPTSKGGTGSHRGSDSGNGHWGADGALFNNSINLTKNALVALNKSGYSATLKGVLWVQGENDALAIKQGLMLQNDYEIALNSLILRYRQQLGNSLPFFIFQTGTGVGQSDAEYAMIRNVQKQVAAKQYNKLVYSGALTFPARDLMWDIYHYKPEGYSEMGSMGAYSVVDYFNPPVAATPTPTPVSTPVVTPTPKLTPTPTPPPQVSNGADQCSLKTTDGRTQFSLNDSFSYSWKTKSGFVSGGQRNKIFNPSGKLITSHDEIVSWGAKEGTKVISAKELTADLTPLLIQNESIKIQYEMMQKSSAGDWYSCNSQMSLTWTRPPHSEGFCEVPAGYLMNCGSAGSKVFHGGICRVESGPLLTEIGLNFKCNLSNKWELSN